MDIEPVYVADVDVEGLKSTVEKVLAFGHPLRPNPTQKEMKKLRSPLLLATKARSWKELAQTGASYGIDWTDRHIRVDMSYRDKQGRWQNDPAKVRIFPPDTPLENVLAVILQDVRSRPELQWAEETK
ncbi:MAG: hypothetical protein WAW20_15220 [Anaerolineae bacterium]